MSVHQEGTTKYRLQRLPISREYRITSETFLAGKPKPLTFSLKLYDQGQGDRDAFSAGIDRLRPQVARAEAMLRGEDVAVPADPVIDKAIAAKVERDRKHAELLAEMKREQEIAGAMLNETNPLWGQF